MLMSSLLMNITAVSALIFLFTTVGAVAFQLALALGAPWGAYAMGGRFPGKLPPAMRVAALVQALLLCLLAAVVLARADLLPGWPLVAGWPIWVVVAFSTVSLVLNTITPSAGERRIWMPVALLLLATSLTVALTTG
jgi:hypothetical protein